MCVCVNAGFIASDWAWLTGQCLDIGAWDLTAAIGGRVPEAVVNFEPREEGVFGGVAGGQR